MSYGTHSSMSGSQGSFKGGGVASKSGSTQGGEVEGNIHTYIYIYIHIYTYIHMHTCIATADNYNLIVSSLDGYMKIPDWSLDVLKQQGNMHGNARYTYTFIHYTHTYFMYIPSHVY